MIINAEVAYCGRVTPRWFARGHFFPTLDSAIAWARTAFKTGASVRLFRELDNITLARVDCREEESPLRLTRSEVFQALKSAN